MHMSPAASDDEHYGRKNNRLNLRRGWKGQINATKYRSKEESHNFVHFQCFPRYRSLLDGRCLMYEERRRATIVLERSMFPMGILSQKRELDAGAYENARWNVLID